MSLNLEFCSESNTSNIAAAGSPWILWPNLSISSSKIRGLAVFACLIAVAILPGIAPTYVFLCPLISDSSVTPPKHIRTYFLFNASAIERAIDVLPVPGGPTKQTIGLSPLSFVKTLTDRNSSILSFTSVSP